MKNTIKLLLISLLTLVFVYTDAQDRREVGNMVLEEVPEIPTDIKNRIQQYQNTRSASIADWLPGDKGMLIATRFGNTAQLHTVNSPGGARNQITFFEEPVGNGSFCPDEKYNGFLFTRDIGGNEYSQIFWYDMITRKAEMLSVGESVNFGINWSNKGDRFAFTSTRRNLKDFDVYISDMKSPKEADLLSDKGGGYWIVADWSPDDTKMLIIQYLSSTKSNSYILDLNSNELRQINDPNKESIFLTYSWDKSGSKIYGITDEGKEFKTLIQYDVKAGKYEYLTESIPWNVGDFTMNKERTKAVFTANENGFTQLYMLDTKDNTFKKVPDMPIGQIYGLKFHPNKNKLGLVINTTATPGDIFVLDLDNFKRERWTYSEVGGLDTEKFPKPELITYETFDEVEGKKRVIPAFVYKPFNSKGQLPVMISIHGGPEGQHAPHFSSFYAYLANELGIAIIAPNVRGSEGYGKTYLKLDNGFNRENSVKDIGKLIDWINGDPDFDGSKIAVFGGSYGGYMVLSSMFNYNDKIKCGIDIVGISNFVTFLENTKEYRRDMRRVEYGDEREPEMREFQINISPTTNANKITKPLFVIQGANDPRVPASEAEQIVKAVRANGGVVWYMLALDEGHGFRKKENRDKMSEAVALFLKEYLLK